MLIDIENRESITLNKLKELSKVYSSPAAISFISYFEFVFGLRGRKNNSRALAFLNNFSCLQTTKSTAHILSDLKSKYSVKGAILPLADLLIAAQVIENNGILLTRDKDFKVIEELKKIVY